MQENFLSPASVKGVLSLDRVTLLVFSPKLSLWAKDNGEIRENEKRVSEMAELLEYYLCYDLDEDFPQGCQSMLFKHHYRTKNEIDIQFGSCMPVRKKVTNESLIEAYGTLDEENKKKTLYTYSPSFFCFRIEYNPNKTSLSSVSELLGSFSAFRDPFQCIRVSRLDIAIDYQAHVMPEFIICDNARKHSIFFGSKGIETAYLGRRSSKNMFRIYDKRQECIDKENVDVGHDLWRIELESKESFMLDSVPDYGKVFGKLYFLDGAVSTGDWLLDMMIENSKHSGSLMATLSKIPDATRKRYRKSLKAVCGTLDIESPSSVFYREFPAKMDNLRKEIFSSFGYQLAT